MIGNYIKRDPDPVQAVLFTGFNFEEINAFLKAKAVYGYLVKTRTLKQIRFFDNFTLLVINVGNYLIFDPKVRLFEVMPEFEFEKKYLYKDTIVEKKDA
jgi:hypothetical protein